MIPFKTECKPVETCHVGKAREWIHKLCTASSNLFTTAYNASLCEGWIRRGGLKGSLHTPQEQFGFSEWWRNQGFKRQLPFTFLFFHICISESLHCWWRGGRRPCCEAGFQPCAGCVAVSQPETLHTVSNPVNHKNLTWIVPLMKLAGKGLLVWMAAWRAESSNFAL